MTTSKLDITNESQEVSPFPAGDHKAITRDEHESTTKARQKLRKLSTKEAPPWNGLKQPLKNSQNKCLSENGSLINTLVNGNASASREMLSVLKWNVQAPRTMADGRQPKPV